MIEIIFGIIVMVAFPIALSQVAIILVYLGLRLGHGISWLNEQIKEGEE